METFSCNSEPPNPSALASRFRSDLGSRDSYNSDTDVLLHNTSPFSDDTSTSALRRRWEKGSLYRIGQTLKFKNLSWSPLEEDPAAAKKKTPSKWSLDPASPALHRWNVFLVASCLVAVSVDPLFYYLAVVNSDQHCIQVESGLRTSVTVFRTITDFCYMIHMVLQFRTAYVSRSSRVFGKGDLVTDPKKIALRYLKQDFWLDLIAVLPIPQVRVLFVFPFGGGRIFRWSWRQVKEDSNVSKNQSFGSFEGE